MRERVTFIHPPHVGLEDPPKVDKTGLQGPSLQSVREDKLLLPLNELPAEVSALVHQLRRLHLRWVSPLKYDTLEPFAARLSPGFHLSFIPAAEAEAFDSAKLCSQLQVFGPLDCYSDQAFTRLGDAKSTTPPAYYFYQPLDNLRNLSAVAAPLLCDNEDSICKGRVEDLANAVILDISDVSYETGPQAIDVKVFWPLEDRKISVPSSPERRTEVGILTRGGPPKQSQNEIGLSGALTVLGQQTDPSPTMFAFQARHRLSNGGFSATFLAPTGLHPTLQLTMTTNQPPIQDAGCVPYVYLTLPRTIFADRHQLADDLFLASKNLTAIRHSSLPVDLEAPEYTTKSWGSTLLLEMARPKSDTPTSWTAEVPLHLRYLKPADAGYDKAEVPYPVVFWACEAEDPDWEYDPFDRPDLGYDDLFDKNAMFWQVTPDPGAHEDRLINVISVPVLNNKAASWVGLGTAAVVTLGFAWVLSQLIKVYWKTGHDVPADPKPKTKKDKKRN